MGPFIFIAEDASKIEWAHYSFMVGAANKNGWVHFYF